MNQLDLKGRHAVITGAATGLGYAIAQRMLESGARVTLWDRDAKALGAAVDSLEKSCSDAVVSCVTVDVARHEEVVAATEQTIAWANVDALVNSAGVTGPNTRLWDYPVDSWRMQRRPILTSVQQTSKRPWSRNWALIPKPWISGGSPVRSTWFRRPTEFGKYATSITPPPSPAVRLAAVRSARC